MPFAQSPWPGTAVAVRTSVPPDTLRASLAASVQALDPDLAITDMMTMDQRVHESLAGDRFMAVLFGGFAAAALVLAALGIYGVMSFAVAQRTHEIGLRMALGAGRDQVLRQILRDGITTSLVGVLLGSIGAYLAGRAMRGMLFGVNAIDPTAFSIVTGIAAPLGDSGLPGAGAPCGLSGPDDRAAAGVEDTLCARDALFSVPSARSSAMTWTAHRGERPQSILDRRTSTTGWLR